MTSTDLRSYSKAGRMNEVMKRLNNSYTRFRMKTGTQDSPGSSSNTPKCSNITQPTALPSTKSASQDSEVCESNMARKSAATKHIEDAKNKVFWGFVDKMKLAFAKETDLKKMEAEYFKLEGQMLPLFRKLCTIQGSESELDEEIEKAVEDLELMVHAHWENISKQHAQEIERVTAAAKTYEHVFAEAVQAALIEYFSNSSSSNLNALIDKSKRKAAAAVGNQDFGKFRPKFTQQIQAVIEKVLKSAKAVADLLSSFHNRMMQKMSRFVCLSDEEFTKCSSEFKLIALKEFSDFKDSEFDSLLKNLLTTHSKKLEQRNRSICQCEAEVALAAMQNVIEFYKLEMQNFCNKNIHTTQVLNEFHNKVSRAAVEYFISACRFHVVSGMSNEEYAAKLQNQFQTTLGVFVNQNTINVLKASTMLSKFTSKAKSEYKQKMMEKLNARSVTENQLRQFHDSALDQVLTLFKLDIKEVAENCEEEVESLRSHIDKYFPDWQEENADMRQREAVNEAEDRAARDRLLEEQEQVQREKEERILAEAKNRRQTEAAAARKEQTKASSYKSRPSEKPNVGETSFQNNESTGTAAAAGSSGNIHTGNTPNVIAIELGLKFVRAGYMNSQGDPELILLEDNRPLLAPIIGVKDKNIVFGEEARICSQSISLADLVTEMNVTVERVLIIEGKEVRLRLEHLTALLLTHVKQKCEEFIGSPVSRAIITIPSWCNQELRRATKDAASLAGFVQNRLISEASAVAIAWYNEQQLKGENEPGNSTNLLVAVVSDFSFDVAGFEVDQKSVVMRKNVGRMNVSLGLRSTIKTLTTNRWTGSAGVDPDTILQKSKFKYGREADQSIFVKSTGYEGRLNKDCLKKYSKTPIFCYDLPIQGAILYSGPLQHLQLKEVTTYSLICKDWMGGVHKISEANDFSFAAGIQRICIDVPLLVLPSSRVKLSILEKVDNVPQLIGSVYVDPPREDFKKLELAFLVDPEGILIVEAKYGPLSASLEFKTNNLDDLELVNAKELLVGLFKSEKVNPEKSRPQAFQNLKAIEQRLRKSIGDSEKILSILKPAILKNVDKIVEGIVESSSLDVLEDAVEKLSKYSEKYCK